MEVHVARADITNMPVDAIVNPTNSRGTMDNRTGQVILKFGGEGIQTALMSKAPLAIGAALVTEGQDLPAKWIIHTPVTSEPDEKLEVENIRRAARAALLAADANKYTVIAIPGIFCGADVPLAEAARAIIEEIRAHKRSFPVTIYLVDDDINMIEAFEDSLEHAQQPL